MYKVGTNTKYDVLYGGFSVSNESSKYLQSLGAKLSGSLDDLSLYLTGLTFSTYDNENIHNCGNTYLGGWWFSGCFYFCLTCESVTGNYYNLTTASFSSYNRIQMTIRP